MATFLTRLLRSDKADKKEEIKPKVENQRKRHTPPCPEGIEVREGSSSLEKQKKVQEKQPPLPRSKHAERVLARSRAAKAKEKTSRNKNKNKNKKKNEGRKKTSGFANLLCMGGNTDTLDRTPLPSQASARGGGAQGKRNRERPDESVVAAAESSQFSQKYVKRREKKAGDDKYRHSAPPQGWNYVMENGVVGNAEDASHAAHLEEQRSLTASPARLRMDGTLERPYVFPGGLTFLAGRKNGKEYRIQSCVLTPEEQARRDVQVDVHDTDDEVEAQGYDDSSRRTENVTEQGEKEDGGGGEWDPSRAFYLKYDSSYLSPDLASPRNRNALPTGWSDDVTSSRGENSPRDFNSMHDFSTSYDINSSWDSQAVDVPPMYETTKQESSTCAALSPTTEQKKKSRYSLPPENMSYVYMGSFENLGALTVRRDKENPLDGVETEYSKSKRSASNHSIDKYKNNSRYSLPQRNMDFVYMGSFEDISSFGLTSTLRESKRKNFCFSLPNISKTDPVLDEFPTIESSNLLGSEEMGFACGGISRNTKEVETGSDSDPATPPKLQNLQSSPNTVASDSVVKDTNNTLTLAVKTESSKDTAVGDGSQSGDEDTLSPLSVTSPRRHSSPFSRNLGRASCNPGNKRFQMAPPPCHTPGTAKLFHFPPPPCYTPPKEEMEAVQTQISNLPDRSCHQGSQTDLHTGSEDIEMEDRDLSLKRGLVKRLSSSLENLAWSPMSLPKPLVTDIDSFCTGDSNTLQRKKPEQKKESTSTANNLTHHSEWHNGSSGNKMSVVCSNVSNGEIACPLDKNALMSTKNVTTSQTTSMERCESQNETNRNSIVSIASTLNTRPGSNRAALTSTPRQPRRSESMGVSSQTRAEWRPTPAPRRQRQSGSDSAHSDSAHTTTVADAAFNQNTADISRPLAVPVPRKRHQLNLKARPQSEILSPTFQITNTAEENPPSDTSSTTLQTLAETTVVPTKTTQNITEKETNSEKRNVNSHSSSTDNTPFGNIKFSTVTSMKKYYENVHLPSSCDTQKASREVTSTSREMNDHHHHISSSEKASSCLSEIVTPLEEMTLTSVSQMGSDCKESQINADEVLKSPLATSEAARSGVGRFQGETTDDENCVADDEMSAQEDDVISGKKRARAAQDLLRSGSVLDRSLILATKHRLRSRDRKCMSQVLSPTQDGDVFFPEGGPSSRRVRWALPEIDRTRGNKSADSGTYSDFNSPCASPDAMGFTFPSDCNTFSDDVTETRDDDDVRESRLKRQRSVQHKSWEVRLRKRHWLRRAVSGEDLSRIPSEIVCGEDGTLETLV
ncbi:probable GPI-anchored adhesin-like protein PGA55 [Aplysia californica]|uniref:Probable GPI-anchored adhesin-like protein PGA55 n=1 Tax=Aplysia californica TaxID=6500 RepID=A0ABM0K0W2_APLCA|nr:probable GPI-anchored adhesin-like protein PGA55 [Aplysia californica]